MPKSKSRSKLNKAGTSVVTLDEAEHLLRLQSEALREAYYDYPPRRDPDMPWNAGGPSSSSALLRRDMIATSIWDRTGGRWAPVYETEYELQVQRAGARNLASFVSTAIGATEALINYVVGKGPTIKAQPSKIAEQLIGGDEAEFVAQLTGDVGGLSIDETLVTGLVRKVQRIIDEFTDANDVVGVLDREVHKRSREDGEVLLVLYPSDNGGTSRLKVLEPEQLVAPYMAMDELEASVYANRDRENYWAFGVHTQFDPVMGCEDLAHPLGYHVVYDEAGYQWDYIPADRMLHIKRNVGINAKRGVSDFVAIYDDVVLASKNERHIGHGAAVQAAIAYIKEFGSGTTSSGAATLQSSQAYDSVLRQSATGSRLETREMFRPGQVIKVQKDHKFYYGPLGQPHSSIFIEVVQMLKRSIGSRWNMPEYMISGDASNAAYASTMMAESPFVKARESDQRTDALHWRNLLWKACKIAWQGDVPYDLVEKLIDITVEFPEVATRDPKVTTERNKILNEARVLSDETWAAKEGLDYQKEQQKIAKQPAKQPAALPFSPPRLSSPAQQGAAGFESLQECGGEGGTMGPCPNSSPSIEETPGHWAGRYKVGDNYFTSKAAATEHIKALSKPEPSDSTRVARNEPKADATDQEVASNPQLYSFERYKAAVLAHVDPADYARDPAAGDKMIRNAHGFRIKKSLQAGEHVPDAVLKEYPKLAKFKLKESIGAPGEPDQTSNPPDRPPVEKPVVESEGGAAGDGEPFPKVRKHGVRDVMEAKDCTGGHWVTVGGSEDEEGNSAGGTPMFICDDGTVKKGPGVLIGKSMSGLNKPEWKQQTPRQEQHTTREYTHAVRRKEARSEGYNANHVEQEFKQLKQQDRERVDEQKKLLATARERLGLSSRNKAFSGGGDVDTLQRQGKAFDDVAQELADNYPHLLGGHDPAAKLFDMLGAEAPKYRSDDELWHHAKQSVGKAKPKEKSVPYSGQFESILEASSESSLATLLRRHFQGQADEVLPRLDELGRLPKAIAINAKWDVGLADGAAPTLQAHYERSAKAVLNNLGADKEVLDSIRPQLEEAAQAAAERFAASVNQTTVDQLNKELDAVKGAKAEGTLEQHPVNELYDRAKQTFKDGKTERAGLIAENEIHRAQQHALVLAARASGKVAGLRWTVADEEACPICLEIADRNEIVPVDSAFAINSDDDSGYGDIEHPPAHVNCRCTLEWVLIDDGVEVPDAEELDVSNIDEAFCPTGKDGGIDNSCGSDWMVNRLASGGYKTAVEDVPEQLPDKAGTALVRKTVKESTQPINIYLPDQPAPVIQVTMPEIVIQMPQQSVSQDVNGGSANLQTIQVHPTPVTVEAHVHVPEQRPAEIMVQSPAVTVNVEPAEQPPINVYLPTVVNQVPESTAAPAGEDDVKIADLLEALRSLPAPVVNVNTIQQDRPPEYWQPPVPVQQQAPSVHMHIPESAFTLPPIQVNVPAPIIQIDAPQLQLDVAAPQLDVAAPQVTVQMPAPVVNVADMPVTIQVPPQPAPVVMVKQDAKKITFTRGRDGKIDGADVTPQ